MRRMSWSRWAAWLSAVAYTVAPFHLVNVYVRGDSLSEFFAFAFYPLILWGLDKLLGREWTRLHIGPYGLPFTAAWIWPALAYAGLIMTHNISAFIFTPFVLLYLLALLVRRPDRWRYVLTTGSLALGFGLLLSAWVWVPALAETDLVLGWMSVGIHRRRVHAEVQHVSRIATMKQNVPVGVANGM